MAKRLQLSNNFALKKCSRRACIAKDRISQLPDDILVHILSFLSVKEAADTSVLSKRWLPLWRFVPRLDFDATKQLDEVAVDQKLQKRYMKKYVRWVNRTLRMCKAQRLDQFRVRFDLNELAQHEIDKWLEFAFARQVQRLELDLLEGGERIQASDYCYTFPAQLLGLNHYAGQPQSNNVHKLPPLWHNFKSVKVLLFKSVHVTGEVLEFFLHNCPFVEEMVVHGSETLVNLEVVGPSLKLKHLEIWFCLDLKSLKICDTNIVTLRTSSAHKLLLSNVPMLIEVDVGGHPFQHILDTIAPWGSCILSQLEVLKIHAYGGLEYLEHYKFPELTKLKKFVVEVLAKEDMSVLGCTHVIGAAPQLKEFELKLLWVLPLRSERECRKAVRCPLHHLKVLRLSGYYGRTSEVELVRYFLENAMLLEKIIVDPCSQNVHRHRVAPDEIARNFAKLQLEGEVPPHIQLLIL
ncbi:F-box/LRR-repeat protein At3g26922-like [Nicotiana tomentosiformis]|uniref:F-box/LRR-repeat protein At3g26922-like n=1 Tax=Nicotiana tomentosiformis TaxID=4098 RepID=UPI00051B14FD|nr:FBD-associated F-box protein At5g38590-like [Nicotiana tomentosiformis]XP_033510382.1 FBD-associated F-box protein At5g38590-like [Nicotiana tomentosiformis]